ncbi:MAG: hypothetical protein DMG34_20445 [Acidobacteria bacterium]|nr:MAG: hypothetical protein DMG34_20445 [Acidobacteriota bacterium]
MKKFAAADIEIGLHCVHYFAETICCEGNGIEQQQGQLAERVSRGVAGHHQVGIRVGQNFAGVVVKNQGKQIFQG